MTNIISSILHYVLPALPLLALCLLDIKVNLDKRVRDRQFPMPIIAAIYAIVAMIFANKICDGLLKLIRYIPQLISRISPQIGDIVKDLLGKINWTFGIFVLANVVIMGVYLAYKGVCLKICERIFRDDSATAGTADADDSTKSPLLLLHKKVASMFYTFDPEKNVWYTKNSLGYARKFCSVFFYTAIFVSTAAFLACRKYMLDSLIAKPFYPVFGIIILGEVLFYIQGYTKTEYYNDILGEDEASDLIVNYSLMRKVLRNIFGDKLSTDDTTVNNGLIAIRTNEEVIENMLMDEDQKIEAFGKYLKALSSTGFELDQNYIFASKDLLNGKSIVFNNPFYNDLIPYAFYPLNRALMNHKKVLVVLGRHAIENDIKTWIEDGITAVARLPYLWRIGVLSGEEQDIDIGIVTRSAVHDIKLHEANKKFFKDVEYVVIIEPSKLLSTAQIGLNSIVKRCRAPHKNIVFCSVDKNCDGLVDSLSHVLMTSLTEVSATNKHEGVNSYMCWDADNEYLHHRLLPNISRYLGVGTELSFVALKNQISMAHWYGGEAYPVTDQFWIDKQYYYELLKYAGLPTKQDMMDDFFRATANFWSAKADKNCYMTVEDESFNMFEIIRHFSTRAKEQGFVNVVSSEYLLKDYMADNGSIFEADPKAIPFFVSDYARTARNVTLRIILMLSTGFLSEEDLSKELSLIGYGFGDIRKQLWYEMVKCYSSASHVTDVESAFNEQITFTLLSGAEYSVDNSLIKMTERYNMATGLMEKIYHIDDEIFINYKSAELFNAGYISEDERGNTHYLGSELMGQVFQKYLPGQFFVFDGKYYEMLYLTGDNHVLVRRAADHIFGRPAYRQIRKYTICSSVQSDKMGSQKDVSGIKIFNEFADISVETPAYLRMKTYKDYGSAKTVSINGVPERNYMNKQLLRIELPDADPDIIYTITVLINEVFKTLFAENQAYICAVTAAEPEAEAEKLRPLTYSIDGEISRNSIYIIEDSQLDIGLLVTVERNLKRIFEIVCDYLEWNEDAVAISKCPPPEPETNICIIKTEDGDEDNKKKKKKCIFSRIKEWFKKLFGKGKKKKKGKGEDPATQPADDAYNGTSEENGVPGEVENVSEAPVEIPAETDDAVAESTEAEQSSEVPAENEVSSDDAEELGEITEDSFEAEENTVTDEQDSEVPVEYEVSSDDAELSDVASDDTEDANDDSATETDGEEEDDFMGYNNSDKEDTDFPPLFSIRPLMRYYRESGVGTPGTDDETDVSEETDAIAVIPATDLVAEAEDAIAVIDTSEDDLVPVTQDAQDITVYDNPEDDDAGVEKEPVVIEVDPEDFSQETPVDETAEEEEAPAEESAEEAGEEQPEDIISGEDEVAHKPGVFSRALYHERYYLLYGMPEGSTAMSTSKTLSYLLSLGFGDNSLKQAREGKDIVSMIEKTYDPTKAGAHFCDFCSTELIGTEFEILADGRERCMQCGRTALKTEKDFIRIFNEVKRNMESFFGIKFNVSVRVRMTTSKKLAKQIGSKFEATPGFDARAVGVAIKDKTGFQLLIENGTPRMSAMFTIAHELTHIWQYLNWDNNAIVNTYGADARLEVYEGMAKWVEIQYGMLINEIAFATREKILTLYRDDEYGRGFVRYLQRYPFSTGSYITKETPFINGNTPL